MLPWTAVCVWRDYTSPHHAILYIVQVEWNVEISFIEFQTIKDSSEDHTWDT